MSDSPAGQEPLASRPHTVYRMYDANDVLLYVGMTANPGVRFESHRGTQSWFQDVCTIKLEHVNDRAEAVRAENAAIATESPRYNGLARPPMRKAQVANSCGPTREVITATLAQYRAGQAEYVNAVTTRSAVVFLTSRGRRVAAIAPVGAAERLEQDD